MPQDNNIKELIINKLTKEQYKELKDNNQLSNTELYVISDNAYYTEEEISILLNAKQNKLTAGDGITIENDVITINLDDFYTSNAIDELLSKKANVSETGYSFDYTDNILTLQNMDGEELSSIKIVSLPELDNITININDSNQLQSIGEITRNGIPKYTWIGTQEEYEQAILDGNINELTECLILDSEAETVTPIAQYDAPTKLSELANDMDFVTQSDLQNAKEDLQNQIDAGVDDINLVHKTGTETIDGFKQFKQKIVIENTLGKGRIAHRPSDSSLEDGYIEFGDNTLLYGKQNIQGELYDEKKNIFHEGNLVAGENIAITSENGIYKINGKAGGGGSGSIDNVDNETIVIQDNGSISAQGVLDQNQEELTALKFWSGTLEEYDALGEWDDNTIYNVTDDMNESGGLPIASVNRLGGVKVDGNTINATQDGIISVVNLNNKLDKSQITNCLLEVPQRINLTLENNTLTLHKGSVAIIPYGTEDKTGEFPVGSAFINDNMKVYDVQFANGKFFVWAETQLDVNYNPSSLSNRTNQLFLRNNGGNLSLAIGAPNSVSSGDTFPDELGWHYHTADNIVYRDTKTENISLPLAIVTNVKDVGCTSIDKIFNGFGYIGITVFCDKGVKCLIPNGRNEDGTLNNIEYTTSTIGIVTSQVGNFNDNIWLRIHSNPISIGVIKPERYHDSDNNYYVMNGEKVQHCVVGKMVVDETLGITEFNVKQPFRAVDWSELPIKGLSTTKATTAGGATEERPAVIVKNYRAGSSWYRVWSDGWKEQGGIVSVADYTTSSTNAISVLESFLDTNYSVFTQMSSGSTNWALVSTNVQDKTTSGFNIRCFQASGTGTEIKAHNITWYACGY